MCTWSLSGARSASFVKHIHFFIYWIIIFRFLFSVSPFFSSSSSYVARLLIHITNFSVILILFNKNCLIFIYLQCFFLLHILVIYFNRLQLFSTILIYMLNMFVILKFKKIVNIYCFCSILLEFSSIQKSFILEVERKTERRRDRKRQIWFLKSHKKIHCLWLKSDISLNFLTHKKK